MLATIRFSIQYFFLPSRDKFSIDAWVQWLVLRQCNDASTVFKPFQLQCNEMDKRVKIRIRLAFPVPRMVDLELAVEADPLDRISLLARISQLVMEAAKASANKFPYIPDLISEILVDDEYLYCIL